MKKSEKTSQKLGKIFAIYMTETELVSKIHIQFQKLIQNRHLKKWVKDVSRYCVNKETQMAENG